MAATGGEPIIYEYSPNTIKKTVVGNGHANKDQVQYMVKQLLKLKDNLPEDASDALAVTDCAAAIAALNPLLTRF